MKRPDPKDFINGEYEEAMEAYIDHLEKELILFREKYYSHIITYDILHYHALLIDAKMTNNVEEFERLEAIGRKYFNE